MPYTNTNNRKTTCNYSFSNIFIKIIFTNCRNKEGQIQKSKTKTISIFKNQFFFLKQK